MSCKYNLVFLILCGFAAPSVSVEECKNNQLEETSCTIVVPKKNDKSDEIRWAFISSNGNVTNWRIETKRKPPAGITIQEDGSLQFDRVQQSYTGTYKFTSISVQGQQMGSKELKMKVYAKAPKPDVKINCTTDGRFRLLCDAGNNKDLTITWYEDDNIMKDEKNPHLTLMSAKVKENKQYSCKVSNPVSSGQSDRTTLSCSGPGFQLFGFDFWIMVGILGGGGLLLLLLIFVLIFCACRSCRQRKKRQLDEEEYRLRNFQDPSSNGTNRSKQTARGQPAPPIPQEESMHCNPSPETPPQTQAQPKPQSRARPPPPPQDEDEEDPPPLPRPRNKQHRKKQQEPYRPME